MSTETTRKQLNIAFDFDGVLVSTHQLFYNELNRRHGLNIRAEDVTEFHLNNSYPVSREQIISALDVVYSDVSAHVIKPGIVDLLEELWQLTHDPILIVTARPPHAYAPTFDVIRKHIPGIPFVLVTSIYGKSTFLKNYHFFVEDRRANALELVRAGKIVYLVDTPYNQMEMHPSIFRIKAVEDLIGMTRHLIK